MPLCHDVVWRRRPPRFGLRVYRAKVSSSSAADSRSTAAVLASVYGLRPRLLCYNTQSFEGAAKAMFAARGFV